MNDNINSSDHLAEVYVTNNNHTKNKWDELIEQLKINRFFIDKDLDIFIHFIAGLPVIEVGGSNFFMEQEKVSILITRI